MLIVRAWRDSSETTVRCRILLSDDVLTGTQRTVAASGTDEVCAVVREWLDDIASRDASVMSR